MDLKNPRIRLMISFLVLAFMLLYTFYTKRQVTRFIPTKDVVYVSPTGGAVKVHRKTYDTVTFSQALSSVKPGEVIYLFQGVYQGQWDVEFLASEDKPVSITSDEKAFISNPEGPCLSINRSKWISVDYLQFKNCKTAVKVNQSKNILFSSVAFSGEQTQVAFLLEGEQTQNIVIEKNNWKPEEVSKSESLPQVQTLSRQNFLIADQILGDLVVRKNLVHNVATSILLIADGLMSPEKGTKNIQIYENAFYDSVEGFLKVANGCYNLWVYNNTFVNAPRWFHFEDIQGGFFYFFGNKGTNRTKYKQGGSVFSFHHARRRPTHPIYIFNNSFIFGRKYFDLQPSTKLLRHYNNLLSSNSQSPELLQPSSYDSTFQMDYDLTDFEIPSALKNKGLWQNSAHEKAFTFKNIDDVDLLLSSNSVAKDKGISLKLAGWESEYYGQAPDIGAYEGGQEFKGPPFQRK